MFYQMKPNAASYARVQLESKVASADPHQLIAMLYDGAILALSHAETAIHNKDIAAKAQWITNAISIILEGLQAALDKEAGGSVAVHLDELYSYMAHRLLTANLQSNVTMVAEVKSLLNELRGAWNAIRDKVVSGAVSVPSRQRAAQPARVAVR